ncbi:MAG: glycosyltransferase family 4 protein [Chloroflexi bacterium]|nr:glycosyltransferase family 4 protein [Chloroflexota bacterium]
MRIGIDYTSAATQGAGIGRYTRELMRALLAQPSANKYSFFYAKSKPIDESPVTSYRSTIRRVPFHDKWLMRVWQRFRIPLPVELIVGKIDLFHSPDFTLPPTLPGVPTLLTVHDLSFVRDPDSAWPSLRAFLNRAVPRSVQRATHVLADSLATKYDLIELFGTPAEKITVLYSGVEPRFAPVRDRTEIDRVCAKYHLPRPFILSVGTLQPRKNYARLIQAFASLINDPHPSTPLRFAQDASGDHHLVITGGKGWLYESIFEQVKSLGLENRVHFPGFVDDADLPALYSAADLFAYVSLYEGFGLPLLEAMACGTPVIASNVSSLPEVVGDVGLQVDPRDVSAITRALRAMLERSDLRETSIAAGLDRARTFTWEKAANQLLSIYDAMKR